VTARVPDGEQPVGGEGRCTCPPGAIWAAELAQLCTATPGVLHYSGDHITLCPPERPCTDAVVHRTELTGWHTAGGQTVDGWYRTHAAERPAQLDLFEVTG
jgi:hypothetical protein